MFSDIYRLVISINLHTPLQEHQHLQILSDSFGGDTTIPPLTDIKCVLFFLYVFHFLNFNFIRSILITV